MSFLHDIIDGITAVLLPIKYFINYMVNDASDQLVLVVGLVIGCLMGIAFLLLGRGNRANRGNIRPKSSKQSRRLKSCRKHYKKIIKSGDNQNQTLMYSLNAMDGFEFELFAMELLRIGLNPEYISTPKLTADYGLDGVLVVRGQILLLQSKHYLKSSLGAQAVTDIAHIRDRLLIRKKGNKFHKMIGVPAKLLRDSNKIIPVMITTGNVSDTVYKMCKAKNVVLIRTNHLLTNLDDKMAHAVPNWIPNS